MKPCLVCRQPRCEPLVDFGETPISHHFFDGSREELRFPLQLGQCQCCAQAQLLAPAPAADQVPRYGWLVNREPEAHLDDLVAHLIRRPGLNRICGLSHKDDSALRRFQERGIKPSGLIDLGLSAGGVGMETIQAHLTPERTAGLPKGDMVIARHALEHAQDPRRFLEALRQVVAPGGCLVVEVPDCAAPFELLDYTAMWEEHTLYFSEVTLRQCLLAGGFEVETVRSYPARYETAVVAVARPSPSAAQQTPPASDLAAERSRVRRFAAAYAGRRELLRKVLTEWRQMGRIALFGAGHHAAIFLSLFDVGDLVEFVVDDNPHKRGLRMPGSRLPIVGSDQLLNGNIATCLSSLGADSERNVLPGLQDFLRRGGVFASIFPTDPTSPLTRIA